MIVENGDVARLFDGRVVYVTDAADQDPAAYAEGQPVETIFIGKRMNSNMDVTGETVVSDMSEVEEVLNRPELLP